MADLKLSDFEENNLHDSLLISVYYNYYTKLFVIEYIPFDKDNHAFLKFNGVEKIEYNYNPISWVYSEILGITVSEMDNKLSIELVICSDIPSNDFLVINFTCEKIES